MKHPRITQPGRSPARQKAFSLIEVTLAIGIVAFAMIPLLGLVPVGLNAAQNSMRQTANTHILNQVSSGLDRLPFGDQVDDYVNQTLYFDYNGAPVSTAADSIFTVTMTALGPSFPGSAQLTGINQYLKRVRVNILPSGHPENEAKAFVITLANPGL